MDDNADSKKLVRDALDADRTREWLMIVDNADDPEVLMSSGSKDAKTARLVEYLPSSSKGKILFTTRSRKAAGDLTQTRKLKLKDMSKAEAKRLLTQRVLNQALLRDTEAVDELLKLLEYLPLAIIQAAAFVDNNDIEVHRYISLMQKTGTKAELFREHFEDPHRYQEMDSTIAKTWHISFHQIQRQDALAAKYLSFMACIDRINIPQSLLPPGGSEVQQARAIGTLKGFAFITQRQQVTPGLTSEVLFDVHRLVHIALGWWLDGQDTHKSRAKEAACRLEQLVPYGGHENREIWMRYLPHALHVAGLEGTVEEEMRASLLNRVGRCQSSVGQYSMAEITHRQALSLREQKLGKEDILVLTSMNELGLALGNQGKYQEAETMHRQTLAQREKVLGAEHPETLTSMNNLAGVLKSQGKYEEAETMHRQTLAQREKVLGAEHPNTLTSMNNLALVLDSQGKYEEAETMHREELEKCTKVLGAEHPDTLTSMNNLAGVLDSQGKYEEAETMHRQTLARREKVLGAEHPDTLTSMNNLALVLDSQGKYEEAETMHRQTLARREKVLGAEHPGTLTSMNNLAGVLKSHGKYEEAETMHRQTLARREKVLGAEHPDTLASMNNLALVLDSQGKYQEAEAMHREELEKCTKVLGAEHPDTLTSMNNLAGVLESRGKYAEAIDLYKETCARLTKFLGKDHPHTRTCRENYSLILMSQQEGRSTGVSKASKVGAHGSSKESILLRVMRKLGFRSSKPSGRP
jgi:tetratricopeptide (TPR) repeat protein